MKNTFLLFGLIAFLGSCTDNNYNDGVVPPVVSTAEFKLFTSSNTSGAVSVTDLMASAPMPRSLMISSVDSEGIMYDGLADEMIVASRSNNRLELYRGFKTLAASATTFPLTFSGSADFTNARETTTSGNFVLVAQDQAASNMNTNRIFVYQKSATGFTLVNTYTIPFKLWGIQMVGSTLYAVVDLASDLCVFDNFLANASGTIMPTKRVTIQGLVRTHGIAYSAEDNRMVLSDVGSAASDTDGGLVILNNFASLLASTPNNGTIALASQNRIYGAATLMGNPVDCAYDYITKDIFVAERLNGGGRVLSFSGNSSGDIAPKTSRLEAGVTSVFVLRK